jgi:hypothetical protein
MFVMQVSHNFGHMCDSSRILTLVLCLTPVVCVTPVVCTTPVRRPDSGRKMRLRSYARLQLEDVTPVICPTSVKRHDSSCMPNSGQNIWFQSYIQTPIALPAFVQRHDSICTSQLWSTSLLRSYLPTLVAHHGSGRRACRMSYQLICERLHMVEVDDGSILWLEHLVRRRLSRVHDLFSVWNLSIS